MTDEGWKILLQNLPSTLAALAAFVSSVVNRRHIQVLKLEINGRMAEFMRASKALARAEGLADGVATERLAGVERRSAIEERRETNRPEGTNGTKDRP